MSPTSSPATSQLSLLIRTPSTRHAHFVRKSRSIGDMSIIQRSSTTLDVIGHDTTSPSFLGTSEFFYDSRAGVYENPLITATSRALISDIYSLMQLCCAVDVPRPSTVLYAVLRSRPPDDDPWFKAIRIWAEVDDISETESFDGHKKSLVEYTLNVLFFPDLHTTYGIPKTLMLHRPPPTSPADSQLSLTVPASPSLAIPGTPVTVPSPLHFQLPVMTRLSFNEQGQITYHRDIWDVRDVVRLIPGVRMMLWFVARAGAWWLSWISHKVCSRMDSLDTNGNATDGTKGDAALLTSQADSSV